MGTGQKVKLSELTEVTTLQGFKALGVNSNNQSVVVDLGKVEEAAEDCEEAASSANEAAEGAEKVNASISGTNLSVTNREGVTTTVNVKGADGRDGNDGQDGKDGNVLYPSMGFTSQGELYVEMPDSQEETNMSIDGDGYLCQNLPNLI